MGDCGVGGAAQAGAVSRGAARLEHPLQGPAASLHAASAPSRRLSMEQRMERSGGTGMKGSDLNGYGRLAVAATLGVTDLVDALHHTIAQRMAPLGPQPAGSTTGVAGLVYASVRGITRGVGSLLDLALSPLSGWRADQPSSPGRDTWLAALNGVMGDRLASAGNPLALTMQLLHGGRPWRSALAETSAPAPAPAPGMGSRLLVLVHGLCMHPGQWQRAGHDHGAALAAKLGLEPLYLHYNSGRAITDNGQALAAQLSALVRDWPVPVRELHLLGHSMGGLVIRAALQQAPPAANWRPLLRSLVFLGTPHRGSPIERAGHWLQALLAHSPYARPLAALGTLRSRGIRDLRHGRIGGRDGLADALPTDVPALALAGCGGDPGASLRDRLLGDGLVPVRSALGRAEAPQQKDLFGPRQQQLLPGVGHFQLLDAAPAYGLLEAFYARHTRPRRGRAAPRGRGG